MKILTMCQGGNTRSVHCAYLLKERYGHADTLACGFQRNSIETLDMLFNWADVIVLMDDWFIDHVPDKYKDKVIVFAVGDDIWGTPLHQALVDKIDVFIKDKLFI